MKTKRITRIAPPSYDPHNLLPIYAKRRVRIGALLRKLRLAKGLKYHAAGQALGVHWLRLREMELGDRSVPVELLDKVVALYQVDINELLLEVLG